MGDAFGLPTPPNQWYNSTFGGTSGATAVVAGVMSSVYGMALANSGSSFFNGWDLRTLVWRTGIPSFPTADAQQRAMGPSVQLGMAAAVFGDRSVATNVGDTFTTVGTTSSQSIVHLYGQKATGVWAQNIFQGGAWHGWNSFPAYANGTQKLKILDSSSGSTTTIDAWALDSAGLLIWSKRANIAPTTNFQAFAQQDTTILQSITPLAFYPGYVNGFGVTATGQLKWYYRPVGATTVYAGSLTIPTPTTLASAIVAVANGNPGSPKVYMFARNTSGQLVYGWSDGGSFFGWTVLNPAETDVTSVDAVLHHEGVMVAAGRGTSTRLGRLNLSNGTWSWSSVPVASPFSVSLTSFEGDPATNVNSVRLTANNFVGQVQSATIYQLNSWVIPSASWWTTWNVVNTSTGLSTTPYRNGEWMTFTIAPNGIPLFRVIDPRFPKT